MMGKIASLATSLFSGGVAGGDGGFGKVLTGFIMGKVRGLKRPKNNNNAGIENAGQGSAK